MRFLSLCSGIEAASVAWLPMGWECAAVSEIEPFPCRLLAHHYPDVPNLGDVTKITRHQIEALGHIDVVIYGFPCTDLSVAGLRKGLKHEDGSLTRSGVFFHCAEISRWAKARWQVVENVPGLISNHSGRDFAAVVGELAGCKIDVPGDGWGNTGVALGKRGLVEWSILDCQYRGLAQRRNRVFLIVDSGNWANRPPILFDAESLRRNPPPRREPGQGIAPSLAARTRGGGGLGTDAECSGACIPVSADRRGIGDMEKKRRNAVGLIAFPESYSNQSISTENCAPCLESQNITAIAFDRAQITSAANRSRATDGLPTGTLSSDSQLMMAHALRGDGFDASEDGTGRGTPLVAAPLRSVPYADNASHESQLVVGALSSNGRAAGSAATQDAQAGLLIPDVAWDLQERDSKGSDSNTKDGHLLPQKTSSLTWGVRRLTPRECERLQGFPDDCTKIPKAKDSPRYRALGNSMPVPVIRYIGEQILEVLTYG